MVLYTVIGERLPLIVRNDRSRRVYGWSSVDLPGFVRIPRLTLVGVATVFDEQVGGLLKLVPVHHRIRVRTQHRPWILA